MDYSKRVQLRREYAAAALQSILTNTELSQWAIMLQRATVTELPRRYCKYKDENRSVQDHFYRMAAKEALHIADIMTEETDRFEENEQKEFDRRVKKLTAVRE